MRLTVNQQKAVLQSLPPAKKAQLKKQARIYQAQGHSIPEIVRKVASMIGSLAKEITPIVFKQFIVPLLLKKAKDHYGLGLSVAGGSCCGGSLKLAGQGRRKRKVVKTKVITITK